MPHATVVVLMLQKQERCLVPGGGDDDAASRRCTPADYLHVFWEATCSLQLQQKHIDG